MGYSSNFDAMALLAANKGKTMEAIVESTIRFYLLPGFQFVQVFLAGVHAVLLMGRRASLVTKLEPEIVALIPY
ncbi:hypothetical protein ZOSMA_2G03070 [Zostera marina]|uniref:Uncharacterized protein n=1 Tax=Zostera marina TaxID=29655 RepID=A0A0K9PDH6_ZOSMR|nr:hypothetical protein ZOSMA_2G03070 [Zostera marina]